MQLTIIGGWGGWPAPGGACSGYLVEQRGFNLLIDPGYSVASKLFRRLPADAVDAVLVSHGHPDHCADLNPLLRARRFMANEPPALPLYALPEALDAVLALDRPSMLGAAYALNTFEAGGEFRIGPFSIQTGLLPHPRPNAGFRISAGRAVLAYTGDAAPSNALVELASGADLLLAEASYAGALPTDLIGQLSSASDVGREAHDARVGSLVLTHLMPGEDRRAAVRAARSAYAGPVRTAREGLTLRIGARRGRPFRLPR